MRYILMMSFERNGYGKESVVLNVRSVIRCWYDDRKE